MRNPPARAALLASAAAALLTLPGLWSGTLWDNSETTYGEVAREIVLRGDWIVMHQNAAPWFVQPPLYFWLGAIFIKLFGVTSFALRLPSALATIAAGGITGYAVARSRGERAGIYAGIVLSTCLLQAVVGRLAIMDALLDLCVTLAIFWWFRALQTGGTAYFLAGWAACGLGFLSKGPVAPVIALLVIVPYAFWEYRQSTVRLPSALAWLGSIALFALIVLPWFGALVHAAGAHSVTKLIGYYTFGRYTGTIENQSGPVWYYIPALVLGFFPWIAFLPSSIAYAWNRMRRSDERLTRLALLWALLPFLFFSFAKTKLPNYIALEMPALAILCALYLNDAVERARSRSLVVSTAAVPVFIVLLGIAIGLFSRQNRLGSGLHALQGDLLYLGLAIFLGSVAAFALLYFGANRRAWSPYALGAAMFGATAVIGLVMLPQAEALKPIPHLAAVINAQDTSADHIAIIDTAGGNALMFYTRPGIYILKGHTQAREAICTAPRTFLIARHGRYIPQAQLHPRVIASWLTNDLYLYSGGCGGR